MNTLFKGILFLIHIGYYVIGQTRVIKIPPCFGVTTESKSHRLIYLTFSSGSPAYTLKTPAEGVLLNNAPDSAWMNCMYALKVPRQHQLSTLHLYLNYGSLDNQGYGSHRTNISTELNLLFYYKTSEGNKTTYGIIDFSSDIWATNGAIMVNKWSEKPQIMYMTLAHARGGNIPVWIRFSITITPIFSCEFSKEEGRVACKTFPSSVSPENVPCVSASLVCDGHPNCPNFDNKIHTADESPKLQGCNWQPPKKIEAHLIYGSIAGFLFLAFTFTLFFSIPELKNICRDCTCFRKKLGDPAHSTDDAVDYNLPIAPPTYSSVESRTHGQGTRCSLFRTSQPPTSNTIYELPPSYILDEQDDIFYAPQIEPSNPSVWRSCTPLKRERTRNLRPMFFSEYSAALDFSSAPVSSISQQSQTTCAELPTYTEAVNPSHGQTTP